MSGKRTGLAAFTRKGGGDAGQQQPGEAGADARTEKKRARVRARGETVALTFRVSRPDWQRLRQLADAEGVSLQTLARNGFSKVLAEHGLPPLEE
jgi:hypothetical protein